MIDESIVAFLDGSLNAYSMVVQSDITIISHENQNEDPQVRFLDFYDFLPKDCIISVTDFNIFGLEGFFYERIFKHTPVFNLTEQTEKYIAYKLMDSLLFCLQNSKGIMDWKVKKIDFKYKTSVSNNFLIHQPKQPKFLLLTFWKDKDN